MVYVLLAEGFEEVEAIAPVDLMRRAGIEVRTVGVTGALVKGARGVTVQADCAPEEIDRATVDMVVLPGGMPGTKNLYASDFVREFVSYCIRGDRFVGAICAAPAVVLGGMGLLRGRKATCFPGMEDGMENAIAEDAPVVRDGRIITGRAAGAAFDFALALIAALKGEEAADQVRRTIYYAAN